MTRHELETKTINQPPEKSNLSDKDTIKENKEFKDTKNEKFEKEKENKDAKSELNEKVKFENEKNVKLEGKNEFQEKPPKDETKFEGKNEVKEKTEKDESKEGKNEFKDDKDAKAEVEPKDPHEKPGEAMAPFNTGVSRAALLDHAQALENAARVLRHFIEQAERPDLRRGALHNEPDQADE